MADDPDLPMTAMLAEIHDSSRTAMMFVRAITRGEILPAEIEASGWKTLETYLVIQHFGIGRILDDFRGEERALATALSNCSELLTRAAGFATRLSILLDRFPTAPGPTDPVGDMLCQAEHTSNVVAFPAKPRTAPDGGDAA